MVYARKRLPQGPMLVFCCQSFRRGLLLGLGQDMRLQFFYEPTASVMSEHLQYAATTQSIRSSEQVPGHVCGFVYAATHSPKRAAHAEAL